MPAGKKPCSAPKTGRNASKKFLNNKKYSIAACLAPLFCYAVFQQRILFFCMEKFLIFQQRRAIMVIITDFSVAEQILSPGSVYFMVIRRFSYGKSV